MLFKETVSLHLYETAQRLSRIPHLSGFRLVGGSALSLQLGHRESVDIDFFSYMDFDSEMVILGVEEYLKDIAGLNIMTHGITFYSGNIKVDIFDFKTKFIREPIETDGIRMARMEDIAAMKLETITQRTIKKDYYDIAGLLDKFTLEEMLDFYKSSYPHKNARTVLEYLMAFNFPNRELEASLEPKSFTGESWTDIKNKISMAFGKYILKLKEKRLKEGNN